MLEATMHSKNAFLTLTYDDCSLPAMGSLQPQHLRSFLKMLRERIYPAKFRFFASGEYGDENWRPHYHAVLFGYDPCVRGRTVRDLSTGRADWFKCCPMCRLVGSVWKKGDIELRDYDDGGAAYIAGYVDKKLTNGHDELNAKILRGRHPEFSRQSRRPGIGVGFLDEIASTYLQHNSLDDIVDVVTQLRHGKKLMPLGSFMVRKLRQKIGRDEKTPPLALEIIKEKMRPVQETAFDNSRSFKEEVTRSQQGAVDRLLNRDRIHKAKRKL